MPKTNSAAEETTPGRQPTGYSTRSLPEKLGVPGEGSHALVLYPPAGYDIGIAAADALPDAPPHRFRFLHAFYDERARLEAEIDRLAQLLDMDGALWISWPKRSSRVPTDVDENVIRAVVLPRGLVDVKVCAVDSTWSGLKMVYRKELRRGR